MRPCWRSKFSRKAPVPHFRLGNLVGSSRAADADPAIHVAPAGLMLRIFPRQPAGRTRGGISPLAAARGLNLQVESRDPREGLQLDLASSGGLDHRRPIYLLRRPAGLSRARASIRTDCYRTVVDYFKRASGPIHGDVGSSSVFYAPSLCYLGAATSRRALRVRDRIPRRGG